MPGIRDENVKLATSDYLEPLRKDLLARGWDVTFDNSLVLHLAHLLGRPGYRAEDLRAWIRAHVEAPLERAESGGEMTQTAPLEWITDGKRVVLAYEYGNVRIYPRPPARPKGEPGLL